MEKIQAFMLRHPYLSMALILPFTMIFTVTVFSVLLNFVLPALLALWLAGWIYGAVTRRPYSRFYPESFWFFR
jgi:hypothetical protein